jgi:hypothetical protein
MKNKPLYFWVKNEIEIRDRTGYPLINTFCVDDNFLEPEKRYGVWRADEMLKENDDHYWEHKPFSQFPREFKMKLLLLGVI